jgi:hypothetical protein
MRPLLNRTIAVACLVWAAAATPALAQAPAFVGSWHWNRAESTVAAGEQLPNDVVLAIATAETGRVQWTLTGTDAKGAKHVESYNGTGDGKPAAVAGAPQGTTAAFTVTPTTMTAAYSNTDGGAEHTTCTLSTDRRKMVCAGTDSDGKGHTSTYRDVYDRQ